MQPNSSKSCEISDAASSKVRKRHKRSISTGDRRRKRRLLVSTANVAIGSSLCAREKATRSRCKKKHRGQSACSPKQPTSSWLSLLRCTFDFDRGTGQQDDEHQNIHEIQERGEELKMADKSPQKPSAKKPKKSLKEKRAVKKAKQEAGPAVHSRPS